MMKKYHIVSIFTLALLSGLQGTIFTFAQSSDANFVLERMMLNSTSTSYADKITYMDGLGRITETIQKGICPSGKDLVSVQEYDFAGRPSKSWLATPYSSGGNYINPSTLISASQAYYGESGSFMLNEYEYSPLARIKKQYGAGNDWQSKGKAIQSEELVNESSGILSCANYSTTSNKSLQKNGIHSAGSLFVAKKTDEDGHIIYTFTDNSAQMLLSRTVVGSVLYDTYYVYDESGQLYYVLPPAASDALTANTTYSLTNQILKDFAYIYRYDNRNRRSEIKKPGCEAVYFKYDKANLLIFSQDGVQRSKSPGEWTFYLYDSFGRNVIKGYCSNSSGSVESAGSILVTCNYTGGSSSFMNSGYTLSNLTLTSAVVEAVYYYDTYDFLNLNPFLGKSQYPLPSVGAKGMQTASVISLTGSSDKISTATYYDLRSRAVKIVSSNHLGGYETENISYTFTGKPLSRTLIHTSQLTSNQTEIYTYTYSSPAERLAQVCHQLNTNSQVVLSDLTYDELGRIKTKKRHGNLETNSYSYNIRDWLTGINGPYFSETLVYNGGTSPLYNGNISSVTWKSGSESVQRGYKFTYDNLGRMLLADYGEESSLSVNTGRFNEQLTYDKQGNIQSLIRRGKQNAGYGVIDNLTYVYSGNKLTKVTDSASDPLFQGAYNFIDGSNSSTEYVYDSNGNVIVDSNKGLCSVVYNRNNLPEHMQFSYGHTISNLYDSKGSKLRSSYVTTNQNLYVPIGSTVTVSSEKVLTSTVRDYCGRIIYENNVLSKILMEEGYITLSGSTPIYHYYEQDNLGNNRVVVNQNGTIEQVTHYYPYGLPFSEGYDNSQQPYKYNGKELDRMHGLDWYDYGARNYDAAIPVWTTVDPLAEKHPDISPYVYCAGNPVNLIDPDGMDWVYHVVDGKTEVYYDRDVKSQDDIVNKYGKDSGVTHMSDGSTLTTYAKDGNVTSEYTFTNENKENKYGTVTDTNGDKLDNTKIKSGSNYTIFGTSDNSVNAETLHKNMFGSSYIGPNNPKDYNRKDSYQYKPTWSPTEMAAYTHDLEYDALGAKGIGGALSPSTKCADMQLIYNCKQVLKNPNSSSNEKSRAKKIIAGFSAINFFKP